MEPPAKRLKADRPPHDDPHDEANDDELCLPPGEFEARQDPLYELDKSRAKAVFKLKSRFESIFDKYERDFDGEGDEVNLHTGEVIINNGHLQSLEDEKDKEDLSADEEEEGRILQGKNPPSTSTSFTSGQSTPSNAVSQLQNNWAHPPRPNAGLPGFSGLSIAPAQHYGLPQPFAAFAPAPVDPMWQTPELQMGGPQGHLGLFGNAYSGQMNPFQSFGYGGGIGRTLNRRAPRRIATAKELAVRNRQDDFLGEELAEEEEDGNGSSQDRRDKDGEENEDGLLGVAKEHGRPEQQSLESTKQGSQKRGLVPSTAISKGHFPKSDSIKKGRPTTVDAVQSGSHTSLGVSDKIRVEDVTSTKAPDPQARQEEHCVPRNELVQCVEKTGYQHTPEQSSSFVIELQSAPGGVLPQKQLVAKKIRKEESLKEGKDTAEGSSEGSQSRRSGRPRAKPEFYGNVSWLKTRRPKSDLEAILDLDPNEEDDMRPEGSGDDPDVEMAIDNAPDDTEFLFEENIEDLQPGDVGNKAFIEAAESIFLSRSNNVTESPEWAHEPTPTRYLELQPQATVSSEQAKPAQQAESFSRNQIDPSYDFSDDEDMFEDPESPKLPEGAEPGLRKSPETEGEVLASSNGTVGIAMIPEADESSNTPTNLDEEVSAVESLSTTTTIEAPELSRKTSLSETNNGEITNAVLEEAGEEENAQAASPEILVDRTAIAAGEAASRGASPEEREYHSSGPMGSPELRGHASSPSLGSELSPSLSRAKSKPGRPCKDSAAAPRTPTKKAKTKRPLDNERGEPRTEHRTTSTTTSATNRLTASAKKHALASLIPDNSDDEDEISILAHTPTSSRHADAPASSFSPLGNSTVEPFTSSRRARNRSSLGGGGGGGSAAARQPGSRHHHAAALPATDARRRSKTSHRAATAFSSPLLQRVLKTPRTARRYHNPSSMEEEGLVRTPDGTMRRCGADGFVCDRDFCLTCCK